MDNIQVWKIPTPPPPPPPPPPESSITRLEFTSLQRQLTRYIYTRYAIITMRRDCAYCKRV